MKPEWIELRTRAMVRRLEVVSVSGIAVLVALSAVFWVLNMRIITAAAVGLTIAGAVASLGIDYRARTMIPSRLLLDETGVKLAYLPGGVRDIRWPDIKSVSRLPSGSLVIVTNGRERMLIRTSAGDADAILLHLQGQGVR